MAIIHWSKPNNQQKTPSGHTQQSKQGRLCRFGAMARKEIKLEDAISEIVVADSNWELGAEGSNVDYFEEEEEEQQQQLQASAKSNHRLQQLADYQPGDCLKKEHKYSFFVGPAKCGP